MKMDKLNTGAENDGCPGWMSANQKDNTRSYSHTYIHWERYGHLRTRKTIEITTHTQKKRRNFDRASSHSAPTGYKHKYTCVSLTWGECYFCKSYKLCRMFFLSPELKRNVMQSCTSGGGTRNLKRKGEKIKKFSSFL